VRIGECTGEKTKKKGTMARGVLGETDENIWDSQILTATRGAEEKGDKKTRGGKKDKKRL